MRRKYVNNRLPLIRDCGTCGERFTTTADTPFVRSIKREDGHYKTTYYCCESCKRQSYKYDMCANQIEKRREKDSHYAETHREQKAINNKRYYEAHKESIKAKHREQYKANPEFYREANRYSRMKRKLRDTE